MNYSYSYEGSLPPEYGVPMIIGCMVVMIVMIVCMWKIFEKAGEPGWKSIIPFLSTYTEFKIAFGNGWMFLLCLIPIVNFVILIMLFVKLAKAFGKGVGMALLMLFVPIIGFPLLAFGDAQYIGPQ